MDFREIILDIRELLMSANILMLTVDQKTFHSLASLSMLMYVLCFELGKWETFNSKLNTSFCSTQVNASIANLFGCSVSKIYSEIILWNVLCT